MPETLSGAALCAQGKRPGEGKRPEAAQIMAEVGLAALGIQG